jgi:hypothetical protein
MARDDEERVNTGGALPPGEHEPSPHSKTSPPGGEADDHDPEAPPWNFLFVFPLALLAPLALIALVMFFGQ